MVTDKKLGEFMAFAARYRLFDEGDRLLLGISGGVDSVVMGRLFFELGVSFGVAHCNFKLRGEASDGDEAFVKQLADTWMVPFFTVSFDTMTYAAERGVSTQMAARELRYEFFENTRRDHDFSAIATAHHVDDALETILLNLSHGTGFQGLTGIAPRRDHYIRPMLAFTGGEIREMAAALQLSWREDASNAKVDYERNKLRHQVVPVLAALNPSLSETMKNTLERLWATGDEFQKALRSWESKHLQETDGLVQVEITGDPPSIYLYESLKKNFGLSYKSYQQLETAMTAGATGKLFYTETHSINVDRGRLLISRKQEGDELPHLLIGETDELAELPLVRLSCEWLPAPVGIDPSPAVAQLDGKRLAFPLELRPWRQGDAFVPLGMKGQKKVSDFMIDAKIPVNLKGRVYVLTSAGEIVWVVGMRIDDRYKVTQSTQRVYRIEIC